jgi:hypothetical protein
VYASVGTALFFSVITLMEGRPGAVPAVVAAKFLPTLAANYAIWPLAHLSERPPLPASRSLGHAAAAAAAMPCWLHRALSAVCSMQTGPLAKLASDQPKGFLS